MTFSDAVKSGFKKYFEFSGRASRSEYWYFLLFIAILYLVAEFIDVVLGWEIPQWGDYVVSLGPLYLLVLFGTVIPLFAAQTRRLHDTDRSGWWGGGLMIGWVVWTFIYAIYEENIAKGALPKSLELFFGAIGLTLIGFTITIIVLLCLRGTKGDNRFGSLASASGKVTGTFGQTSPDGATGGDLEPSHWVLSGFDSVGNIVRLEFDAVHGRDRHFVIGRNRDACDLVIVDQGVSRRHAEISVTAAGVFIRDLGSSNGTILNGQKLTSAPLRFPANGTLTLGAIELSIFGS